VAPIIIVNLVRLSAVRKHRFLIPNYLAVGVALVKFPLKETQHWNCLLSVSALIDNVPWVSNCVMFYLAV